MSDQTSIFNEKETPTQQSDNGNVTNTANSTPYEDLLKEIKNERGEPKYNSIEEALKGAAHAQNYISEMKGELSKREEQINTFKSEIDEVRNLKESVEQLIFNQQQSGQPSAPVIDEGKIAELVGQTLTQRQQAEIAKSNVNSVVKTVKEKFGDKAEEAFYTAASEFGMSVEEINSLAARSPKAVFSMLGISQTTQSSTPQPTGSSVNTEGFKPQETSSVGRNKVSVLTGASTQEVANEMAEAKKMLEELYNSGVSLHELSDPKKYNQFFK